MRLVRLRVLPLWCCSVTSSRTLTTSTSPEGNSSVRRAGYSEDDAFGQPQAIDAVMDSVKMSRDQESRSPGEAEVETSAADAASSARNKRRSRKQRTYDQILGDVLNEALRQRDSGGKPDMDFIYRQTQQRAYESEYGVKPPSQKDQNAKYIPFPPDFQMNRLVRNTIFDDDPWPERSITPENPVFTVHEMEKDKELNAGRRAKAQEEMYEPRANFDPVSEFADAVDELSFWEIRFLDFVRDHPLWQRRTLPLLHEHYRALAHRLLRAEKRFVRTRDVAMPRASISTTTFKRTEDRIERLRSLTSEVHKSLSSPTYDPLKMRKGTLGKFMAMTGEQYNAWKEEESHRRNELITKFSDGWEAQTDKQ